jgi:hypothetical protein
MRPKWILASFLVFAGASALQAGAQTPAQTPAAQLTCTSSTGVFTVNLIGYDLDLKKTLSTGSGAGVPTSQFTADTKLDQNFLTLLNAYGSGKTFSSCNLSRSSDPDYEAILKTVSISELQVIDNVSPHQNGKGSGPYVEVVLSIVQIEIEHLMTP